MNTRSASSPLVALLMGSISDWPILKEAANTLRAFNVPFEARVLSAHRTPEEAAAYARTAEARGLQVLIAAAGGAAHLAGALAAHSTLPVLGIPLSGTPLQGQDALLATLQMPPGIPVGTLAIGAWGATNAALLAVQILALHDADLRQRLHDHRTAMKTKALAANAQLQQELAAPAE